VSFRLREAKKVHTIYNNRCGLAYAPLCEIESWFFSWRHNFSDYVYDGYRVSVDYNNASMNAVMRDLENKTGLMFPLNVDEFPPGHFRVTMSVDDFSLFETLNFVSGLTGVGKNDNDEWWYMYYGNHDN
jgi:hypothetical protein